MQASRIAAHDGPVGHGAVADSAGGQDNGRGGAGVEVGGGVLGEKQRGKEAHVACALDGFEGGVLEGDGGEGIAGGEDEMVEFAQAFFSVGVEGFDIRFHGGAVGEIAWEAGKAVLGGGVGC